MEESAARKVFTYTSFPYSVQLSILMPPGAMSLKIEVVFIFIHISFVENLQAVIACCSGIT